MEDGRRFREPKHWLDYMMMVATVVAGVGAMLAAGASAWQAYIARDVEHLQLRAYVEVAWSNDEESTQFDPAKPLHFKWIIKNTGLTPAYHVVGREHGSFYDYPLPASFDFRLKESLGKPSTAYPNGNSEEQINDRFPSVLSDEIRSSITSPNKVRWVSYGTVDYDDIFGRHHFTNFCDTYGISTNGHYYTERCDRHNDSN